MRRAPSSFRALVVAVNPLLQRRQCSPLLLDDSSLAIERRALVGNKLPQFRNRRVSTRRRLRERGTGKHEQGNDSQDAEPNTIRPHRGVSYAGSGQAPEDVQYREACGYFIGGYTVRQSSFMLTMVQPFASASSQPLSNCWSLSVRS